MRAQRSLLPKAPAAPLNDRRRNSPRVLFVDAGRGEKVVPGLVADVKDSYTNSRMEKRITEMGDAVVTPAIETGNLVSQGATRKLINAYKKNLNVGMLGEIRSWYNTQAPHFSPEAQLLMLSFIKVEGPKLATPEPIIGVVQGRELPDPPLNPMMLDKGVAYEEVEGELTVDGLHWDDPIQGRTVGTCGALAAMIILPHQAPEFMEHFFKVNEDRTVSAYLFVHTGEPHVLPRRVWVTTQFKLPRGFKGGHRDAAATSRVAKELWPSLLEKLMAQLKGGYEHIENDWGPAQFMMLTGNVADSQFLFQDSNPERVYQDLEKRLGNKEAIVACTYCPNFRGEQDPSALSALTPRWEFEGTGVFSGHQYAVRGVYTDQEGKRFVKLRNPHGMTEPYLDAVKLIAKDGKDDGNFDLPFDQFIRFFVRYDAVRTDNLPTGTFEERAGVAGK